MKPVSVIFLIVAAVMMIAGILLCTIATVQAKSQDISLFDTQYNENNELEYTFSFTNNNVSKVQVNVDEADIEIICNAEYDKIEVINFPTSQYICEVQNKALVMESGVNLFSLMDIAQGNIRFKGLRHYLHNRDTGDQKKRITIYIAYDTDIKVLDIATKVGNVTISGYNNSSDYIFNIGSGILTMSDISTDSNINITIDEGGAVLQNIAVSYLTAEIGEGDFRAFASATEINATVGSGNITVSSSDDLEKFNFDLSAVLGTIDLNGQMRRGVYNAYNPTNIRKIKAQAGNGNVTVKQEMPALTWDNPETGTEPATTEETSAE